VKKLIKPEKLKRGDKVATVSLSWGGAGDKALRTRYEIGKKRLEEVFGLEVVEMEHTLSGTEYVYNHPKERAEDLMKAFLDPEIKAIISCIGGDDTVRLFPYIDFDIIRNNPKIFMGYSDTTANHFMMYKAGLSSFYGPAILTDFAENVEMSKYTVDSIMKTLFTNEVIGEVKQSEGWTSEYLIWEDENNNNIKRKFNKNTGYELLQGNGKVTGPLIGGCMEVIEMIKGTELYPEIEDFQGAILFFETSEEIPKPEEVKYWLRNYGLAGILDKVNGIIFGKPKGEVYIEEYKNTIVNTLKEFNKEDLPVLYNLSFGHCEPKFIIPYGALAEINCKEISFSILESGCN
jgi:muramoyltetrapeptide carboxypeptidase LdcA involved in peptidoglycan recycling